MRLGCESDEKLGVFISKVKGAKEKLIKTYPIDESKSTKMVNGALSNST